MPLPESTVRVSSALVAWPDIAVDPALNLWADQ